MSRERLFTLLLLLGFFSLLAFARLQLSCPDCFLDNNTLAVQFDTAAGDQDSPAYSIDTRWSSHQSRFSRADDHSQRVPIDHAVAELYQLYEALLI